MMRNLVQYTLFVLVLVVAQVLVFNQLNLWGFVSVFVYLLFLVVAPMRIKSIRLMLLSFVVGLSVDMFSQSYGIHTFSVVLVAFLRPKLLLLFMSAEVSEVSALFFIKNTLSYYKYVFVLVFIYCLSAFFIEVFDFTMFGVVVVKSISSTVVTTTFIFVFNTLFLNKYINER